MEVLPYRYEKIQSVSQDASSVDVKNSENQTNEVSSRNFTPQVNAARNQSQIFNRKSISRNTTHRQSYHLQAMLTGVKRRKVNTSSEKVNNLKTAKLTAQMTKT